MSDGVGQGRHARMKKRRIAHECQHFTAGVEQSQSAAHCRGGPHTHEQLAHFVRRKESQGVAADIRKVRPPEPYKGKGVRYDGEQVKIKAGKTIRFKPGKNLESKINH